MQVFAEANPSIGRFQSGRLRQAESQLRANLQQFAAQAGPGATVQVQYTYEVGPDGRLYAVDAVATSSEKVAVEEKGLPDALRSDPGKPIALENFLNPRPKLTPEEELNLFGLTDDEQRAVDELRFRDVQVRGHEAQHYRAAGELASGGPQYVYQQGADGNFYAIGGHVNIQSSGSSDPEKASRDAATFQRAATAPGDASAQDISVARSSTHSGASVYSDALRQHGMNLIT